MIVKVTHTNDQELYERAKRELNLFRMFHKSKRICDLINGTFKDTAHGVPATCICVLEMFQQGTVRTLLDKSPPQFTERLTPNGPFCLRFEHAIAMSKDVLDGLECMHRMKIVHRDIKPANICVELVPGSNNQLRYTIIDLGSAVSCVDEKKEKDTVGFCDLFTAEVGLKLPLGTVPFMSPEHLDPDRCVSCRSDIFSLGVTIYNCLSGRFPFVQPHPLYDENRLARELFKFYASENEAQPLAIPVGKRARDKAAFIEIVMKALWKDPAERFASAVAFKETIEQSIARCRAWMWIQSVDADVGVGEKL